MAHFRAKAGKYKISLEQLMVLQIKEMLKKKDRTLSEEHRCHHEGAPNGQR